MQRERNPQNNPVQSVIHSAQINVQNRINEPEQSQSQSQSQPQSAQINISNIMSGSQS